MIRQRRRKINSADTAERLSQESLSERRLEPSAPPPEETSAVACGTYRQIREYSLVLLSQGISHRLERSDTGPFEIYVTKENETKSILQLELYRRENPPREMDEPIPLSLGLAPLWVLSVPTLVTAADFLEIIPNLNARGISDADKVLDGEWWRTITALTLHGDLRHIAGNLVSGYVALNLLSTRIPIARIAPFIAASSAMANSLTVVTVRSDYRSLGFSTFVFATMGTLSVIEFRLMPRESHGIIRRFAPLCGAILLAVFLGLGENADILGHAYGFVMGCLCGFIPKKSSLKWGTPSTKTDFILGAIYFVLFALAWIFAFR